jgi:hypothetical protein
MNLVKLQDDLKMLPMAALQSKAQGQDPQVPPWLATSVLNERMDAQKKAGLAQGAQGEQPSIAEQLNQKAGLMALQGQQQQQAQQQMMSQMAQAPQPTPEGVPQPEQQPQPQMMAEGGLARLPVNPRMFDYRAGGIIGFAGEGEIPPADEGSNLDAVKVQAEQAIANLRRYGLRQQQQDPEGYQKAQQAAQEAQQAVKNAMTQYQSSMEKSGMTKPAFIGQKPAPQATGSIFTPGSQSGLRPKQPKAGLPAALPKPPEGDVQIPMSPELRAAMEKDAAEQGITNPQFNFQGPRGSTATLTPQAAPTSTQAPQPTQAAPAAPTGIQTVLPQAAPSELENMQMAALRKEPTTRTMADMQAERKAAAPALLNEPAGLAQLARMKQQQEQYEKGKEGRAKENWMRGLAAAARGGIGGFGTSYLETAEGGRSADAAQAAYQDKVMTAIEAAQRGEATTEQNALLAAMGGERSAQAEAAGKRLTAIGTARNTESQAKEAGLDRDSREKIAKLERDMRQAHYLNPISAPTDKDKWIKAFMRSGLSETAAIEKVMGLTGESKERMAGARIDAANAKILADDMSYVNAVKIMDDPNKSPAEKARAKQYKDAKEKALGIAPETTAPTMTPAQAAALAKYGAK